MRVLNYLFVHGHLKIVSLLIFKPVQLLSTYLIEHSPSLIYNSDRASWSNAWRSPLIGWSSGTAAKAPFRCWIFILKRCPASPQCIPLSTLLREAISCSVRFGQSPSRIKNDPHSNDHNLSTFIWPISWISTRYTRVRGYPTETNQHVRLRCCFMTFSTWLFLSNHCCFRNSPTRRSPIRKLFWIFW